MSMDNIGVEKSINSEFLAVKKEKVDASEKDFDIKNARNYDDSTFRRELFDKYTEGYVPTLEESKVIICKWLSKEGTADENLLPWPEGIEKSKELISDDKGYFLDENKGIVARSKNGKELRDYGEKDPYLELTRLLVEKMSRDDIVELNKYLVENYLKLSRSKDWESLRDLACVRDSLGNGLNDKETSLIKLSKLLYLPIGEAGWKYNTKEILDDVLQNFGETVENVWGKEDPNLGEIKKKTTGSILMCLGVAEVSNSLRDSLGDESISEAKRAYLSNMARLILNIDERMMIHLNLNSVYKIVDFDNYPISLETRKFRKDFLVKMFDKLGVKSDKKILDLGCGTGWLIGDLMDAHFSNVKGFDKSEKNLEIARQKYGDNFVEGDWERLSGLVDQQKAIVSLGRTLPHVESDFGFDNVLENVYYALDNNGYFIFDMPDPTVEESEYKKEVSRYRDVLKKFGCESVDIDNVFCIVDSPDGENFYNRYVPPKETILEKLEMFDFEVLEVINEKIPGYIHDRNMVFVCQKKRITNY